MKTNLQTEKPELILWCGGDEPGLWTVEKNEVEEEIQEEGGLTQDDLIDVLSLYLF
jgi:hypothetical protein